MILALAAVLAAAQPSTAAVAGQVSCLSRTGGDQAVCLATQYSAAGRFADAAAQFETAAAAAGSGPAADRALAAAGNMWIAAGEPGKAALALDRALAGSGLKADQRAHAVLDRARAAEAQGDLKTARARLTEAAKTIGSDPFLWYFSAALAIREEDKATAQTSIARALTLAPADPSILFEAGHVAHFTGDEAKARDYWMRTVAADPNGAAGKAAREALRMMPAPVVTKGVPATK